MIARLWRGSASSAANAAPWSEPEARAVLKAYDELVSHYQVVE